MSVAGFACRGGVAALALLLSALPAVAREPQVVVDKLSNGFWLVVDDRPEPAFTGIDYAAHTPGEPVDYAGLLDETDGGRGDGRRLAQMGVRMLRIASLPHASRPQVERTKSIFRQVHAKWGLQVLVRVAYPSAPLPAAPFRDHLLDARRGIDLYHSEPWLLGWYLTPHGHDVSTVAPLGDESAVLQALTGAMVERLGELGAKKLLTLEIGGALERAKALLGQIPAIGAVGIALEGSAAEAATIVAWADQNLDRSVYFTGVGMPARTLEEQRRQSNHISATCAALYANAAGHAGSGNVLGVFVREATDDRPDSSGDTSARAAFGVLGKRAEGSMTRESKVRREFWQRAPRSDSPDDLLAGAWRFANDRQYGYALAFAGRLVARYGSAVGDRWAADAVATAHFIMGKCFYELAKTFDAMGEYRNAADNMSRAVMLFDAARHDFGQASFVSDSGEAVPLENAFRGTFPDLLPPYVSPGFGSTVTVSSLVVVALLASAFVTRERRRPSRGREPPRTISALASGDKACLAIALTTYVAVAYWFLAWWIHPVRAEFYTVSGPLFWILTVIGLLEAGFFLAVACTLWVQRQPVVTEAPAAGRVALVTTYVASESMRILTRTLVAMTKVRLRSEVFVLDETNGGDVRTLCRRLGVTHFSRKGYQQYNQEDGRHQRNTKGGNLNAWLYQFGDRFDFVTFFDTDHGPHVDYLERVLPHFQRASVAVVQPAPCYGNQADSWVARGAAEQSYLYHGAIHPGFAALGAAMVNGSHSTFRINALLSASVSGYAVHDADDILSSLRLHCAGHETVYLPEVLAIGMAPETFGDYLRQQVRWASSMFNLAIYHYPFRLGRVGWKRALCYLMLPSYYLGGLLFFLLLWLPVITSPLNQPPVNAELVTILAWLGVLLLLRYAALLGVGSRRIPTGFGQQGLMWFRAGILWVLTSIALPLALVRAIRQGRTVPDRETTSKGTVGSRVPRGASWTCAVLLCSDLAALSWTLVKANSGWPVAGMIPFHVLVAMICTAFLVLSWHRNSARS